MRTRIFPSLLVPTVLAGCNMVSQVQDGMVMSNEAAGSIHAQVGVKPTVGFNYMNGTLTTVTVQFAEVPKLSVLEVESLSRSSIEKSFKAQPKALVIAYVFEGAAK